MGMFIVTSAATDLVVPTGSSFATNLFPFGNPAGANLGDVTIERNSAGATAWVNSTGLTAGKAYTLWWVIWNDPTLCAVGCDAPDLGIPGNSVFLAASGVASAEDELSLHAHTPADGSIDGAAVIPGGLTDTANATIHLVVRDHGAALAGDALIAQITQSEASTVDGSSSASLEIFQPVCCATGPTTGDPLDGDATLTRSAADGFSMTLTDPGLVAGNAYSVWWVIFQTADAAPLVLNATGGIADVDGVSTFSADIAPGAYAGDLADGAQVLRDGELHDPLNATVWLVVKEHGAASADADALFIQTRREDGPECLPDGCVDPHRAIFSVAGNGVAVDVQAAVSDGSNLTNAGLEVFQSVCCETGPETGNPVAGTSTVNRTVSGLQMTITDPEVVAGNAYSVWWIVDQPGIENHPAGPFDLILNATGAVADADGVSATLALGTYELNPDATDAPQVLIAGELVDPVNATVWLVVKEHGAASEDAATLFQQLRREDGAECPCVDPHRAVHAAQ